MRFTMIATYLAIIVTTLVLMSIYIISLLSENLYSTETINMFAKANIISETIADVWGSDTSATSAQKFSDVVERSLAGTNIRGVVTNKSYSVLYDTNEESQLIGKVFMRDVLKRALDGEQADIITTGENNMRLISVAVPVTFGGEIIGSVYLAESINTIDDTVRTTRNSLIVFSTLIVILIGMLSLGMSYIITSPIEEFIAVAKEISRVISQSVLKLKVIMRSHKWHKCLIICVTNLNFWKKKDVSLFRTRHTNLKRLWQV